MVYYRVYRPQTIAQLDNPKLRETLYAVLSSKNIPHAFLFTGPKGLGKTSTARIIAKVLNCEHLDKGKGESVKDKEEKKLHPSPFTLHPSIEPDNTCDQCISITNGTNIDVLEIDGASNRGIDEIRDLREKVNLVPVAARKKVYIIDEVHMLTTEAFNALLKTIEEPPSHVVFILATTEPQKVPSTIASRCFHIALTKATGEELIHSLQRIVVGEHLVIDENALEQMAQSADGSFRDASKILEEIVAVAGSEKITKQLVVEKLQISGIIPLAISLLDSLQKKNVKETLGKIQQIVEKGIDIKFFIQELLEVLHSMLLINLGLLQSNREYPLSALSFPTQDLTHLVALLEVAYKDTKFAVIPQLPLELAVIEWSSTEQNVSSKNNRQQTQSPQNPKEPPIIEKSHPRGEADPEHNPNFPGVDASGMTTPNNRATVHSLLQKEKNLKVQGVIKGSNESKVSKEKQEISQNNLPQDASDLSHLLENIIYKVKPYNHSVAGVLRGCSIQSLSDTIIIFQTAYKFHKEKLEEHSKTILEKVIKEVTGKPLRVVVELRA